ncbi:MAG TPA: hypothetical protein VMD59_03525 [Acidimicrobiales bacterium]|nr:hypothetical protein [Acidimicrobiales bacterium]
MRHAIDRPVFHPLGTRRRGLGRGGLRRLATAGALSLGLAATPLLAGAAHAAPRPSAARAEVVLPAPCPLFPAKLVAPALGVPVFAVHGRVEKSKADGFDLVLCVFTRGPGPTGNLVDLTLAPAAFGQAGGSVPGMVTEHPAGLGPKGEFLYDRKAGNIFASAVFVKGGLWGDAYSNVKDPTATVLALGRYAYAHLAA